VADVHLGRLARNLRLLDSTLCIQRTSMMPRWLPFRYASADPPDTRHWAAHARLSRTATGCERRTRIDRSRRLSTRSPPERSAAVHALHQVQLGAARDGSRRGCGPRATAGLERFAASRIARAADASTGAARTSGVSSGGPGLAEHRTTAALDAQLEAA
jgi:hypothetical protein